MYKWLISCLETCWSPLKFFQVKIQKKSRMSTFNSDKAYALRMDEEDVLSEFRNEFKFPVNVENAVEESIYLCGNSLGLLAKRSEKYIQEELKKWSAMGVEGHFNGERPWARIDEFVTPLLKHIVGAKLQEEVAVMNSLTVNLHLLMIAFYRPHAISGRTKIMIEKHAFCSDVHAVRSQLRLYDLDPFSHLIQVDPCEESILRALDEHGQDISVVLLPGVQFYSGEFFDIQKITQHAHAAGCIIGWDLAHAVGNVPLKLHEWGVDFAIWCSYKYLNGGPGAIGGAFLHENHFGSQKLKRLDGWWGQSLQNRFSMEDEHKPLSGAQAFQQSNPSVLSVVSLQGSLDLFTMAGMDRLRNKSVRLTKFLEDLLIKHCKSIQIITSADPRYRGCQLSLLFPNDCVKRIHERITSKGIICDVREPNVMRIAPVPLYNSFKDVFQFVEALKEAIKQQV